MCVCVCVCECPAFILPVVLPQVLRDVPDPGAKAVACWLRALATAAAEE